MKSKCSRKFADEEFYAYLCQSVIFVIFDIIIIALVWGLFLFFFNEFAIGILLCIFVSVCYLLFTCSVNHRIFLMLIMDRLKNDIITEKVKLIDIRLKKPYLDYHLTNNISIFFSKGLCVNKYDLICKNGSKDMCFRLIMSQQKQINMYKNIMCNPDLNEIEVKYYKRIKMLISLSLPNDKKYQKKDEMIIFQFNRTL